MPAQRRRAFLTRDKVQFTLQKIAGRMGRRQALLAGLLAMGIAAPASVLFAERAPERLSNPKHRATYYAASARLNCFCGCHATVGECLHVDEGCFAVQARRFIESRVLEGMNADQIVDGFVHGFGQSVADDPQMQQLRESGHANLADGFVNGFGPRILMEQPSSTPALLAAIGGFGVLIAVLLYLRRRPDRGRRNDRAAEADGALDRRLDEMER